MGLKLEFAEKASAEGANVSALCREYGISRQTGHKWIKRFLERGYDGLEEESRRPTSAPLATAEDVVVAIVQLREAHPTWGAHKLAIVLARKLKEQAPSERTISRVLQRFGKVARRRRRCGLSLVERAPDVVALAPNDVWTLDFKGWWMTTSGKRCEPLTVRDAFSRFVLAVRLVRPKTEAVAEVLKELFRKHGVPKAIQCDNGQPFIAARSRAGLTRLSASWVALGIRIVRSRPAHPQDNGGHERMHRDLKAEVQRHPEGTVRAQQRACDRWRQEFNHVRPHDALKGKVPADIYKPTPIEPRVRTARYAPTCIARKVNDRGEIMVAKMRYFLSLALCGHLVGIEPTTGLKHRVWFHDIDLGEIELAPVEMPSSLSNSRVRAARPKSTERPSGGSHRGSGVSSRPQAARRAHAVAAERDGRRS